MNFTSLYELASQTTTTTTSPTTTTSLVPFQDVSIDPNTVFKVVIIFALIVGVIGLIGFVIVSAILKQVQPLEVPPQVILIEGGVPTTVTITLQIKIKSLWIAFVRLRNYKQSAIEFAHAAVYNKLSGKKLEAVDKDREATTLAIRHDLKKSLRSIGLTLVNVNLVDVTVPEELQKSLIRQAAAKRDAAGDEIRATAETGLADRFLEAARQYSPQADEETLARLAMQLRGFAAVEDAPGGTIIMGDVGVPLRKGVAGSHPLHDAQGGHPTEPPEGA